MFHDIFLPSPAHVSRNFWGCQSSALELGMQVWLRNPAYFFCAKHFSTESAKNKKTRPKRPANIPQNPQNAHKNPQTPANPENLVFGLCVHIVASSVRNSTHVNKQEWPGFKVEPMEGQTYRLFPSHIA